MTLPDDTPILAWHWVADDGTLGQDASMRAVVGETLSLPADEQPQLCRRGFHASEIVTDALQFAPGSKICRVEVWGSVSADHEKLVDRHRKVLWMLDAENILWEHTCWVAERALLERRRANDDRTLSLIRLLPVDTPAPAQPEEGEGRHG